MTKLVRFASVAASLAAILLAFGLAERLDTGEESGGRLTGPMILACFVSVPVLAASIASSFRNLRLGFALWIGGMVLAVPLATWRLAPGWWGMISPWPEKGEHAPFVWDWSSFALLVFLFASLALQARMLRK